MSEKALRLMSLQSLAFGFGNEQRQEYGYQHEGIDKGGGDVERCAIGHQRTDQGRCQNIGNSLGQNCPAVTNSAQSGRVQLSDPCAPHPPGAQAEEGQGEVAQVKHLQGLRVGKAITGNDGRTDEANDDFLAAIPMGQPRCGHVARNHAQR